MMIFDDKMMVNWEKVEVDDNVSQNSLSNYGLNETMDSANSVYITDIEKIYQFINLRQNLKQQLKNSLSKEETKTIQKNNPNTDQNILLTNIIKNLNQQLNEGHTILKTNKIPKEILKQWQEQNWIHIIYQLNNKSNELIKQPIIMQSQNQNQIFWFHRQWFAEKQLAKQLLNITKRKVEPLNINKNSTKHNHQQDIAINQACKNAFSIITGGPGTGKTYTVAQLVIALHQMHEKKLQTNPNIQPLSIALTAPTGKAAQRMQQSLEKLLQQNNHQIQLDNAKTLHRLLGIGQQGTPHYHQDNPLPDDLIIVDEASMLGLELASLLVNAIKPTGRLILLGDANQLAAVDAGAVLADLCQIDCLKPYQTELIESKRFHAQSAIGQLATAMKLPVATNEQKQFKSQQVNHILMQYHSQIECQFFNSHQNISYLHEHLVHAYQDFFDFTKKLLCLKIDNNQLDFNRQLFSVFDKFQILSAGHQGYLGVMAINKKLAQQHKKFLNLPSDDILFHGQPILILKNDYQLGLFNGDIGICLLQDNKMKIYFSDKVIDAKRLSQENFETAYAMTIHKSQGSEYQKVAICLDQAHTRLLSQELIYTAITRCQHSVMIFSEKRIFEMAISHQSSRQTGLSLQF